MKILTTSSFLKLSAVGERRFRGSVYVDIFVPITDNLETDREEARQELEEYAQQIPNSYVGDVALKSGFMLDRDI